MPGVYAFAGVPVDRTMRSWAATLHAGPGCPLALHTAGRLHEFEEALDLDDISLLVPDDRRHPPAGVIWRRQIDLEPVDVVSIEGLLVTSVPRTALDLAAEVTVTRLRRLIESAIVGRGFDVADFAMVLERVRRSGKRGVRKMELVLDQLGPGDSIPHSELERLLDQAIDRAGLPAPRHEHPLPGAGDRAGFVDRCWPEARLIVEADGRRWHTRRHQIALDHDRVLDSQTAGFQTSRFLWEHLHGDPMGSARRLRAIYERRLQDTAA